MSNEKVLKKAIQKAIDGGFNPGASENGEPPQQTFTRRMMQDLFFRHALIFNHDFAKALWGEQPYGHYQQPNILKSWEFHLQQMVIADDPIKYLGENI